MSELDEARSGIHDEAVQAVVDFVDPPVAVRASRGGLSLPRQDGGRHETSQRRHQSTTRQMYELLVHDVAP